MAIRCGNLFNIEISQDSSATHLRCGGIFSNDFIADLIVSPSVKEFRKSVSIWRSYRRKSSVLVFLTHSVFHNEIKICN